MTAPAQRPAPHALPIPPPLFVYPDDYAERPLPGQQHPPAGDVALEVRYLTYLALEGLRLEFVFWQTDREVLAARHKLLVQSCREGRPDHVWIGAASIAINAVCAVYDHMQRVGRGDPAFEPSFNLVSNLCAELRWCAQLPYSVPEALPSPRSDLLLACTGWRQGEVATWARVVRALAAVHKSAASEADGSVGA